MTLLIFYISVALGFSFLCSVAEAVLLSMTPSFMALSQKQKKPWAEPLADMRQDINRPLAAILTLNTIAHTVGAAGAGAQAAVVFGSGSVAVASAVLTLLILVFSEIIPKTLGATYWKTLAPATVRFLQILIVLMAPFVWLSSLITSRFSGHPTLTGFSRREFSALAEEGVSQGKLDDREFGVLNNLLLFSDTPITDVMTPRTVVFSLDANASVNEFIEKWQGRPFTRIPIYEETKENLIGFVLRPDLMLAASQGDGANPIKKYSRPLPALINKTSLSQAFETLLELRAHIMMVVDEYGGVGGIVTLEDVIETLLGLEIVDERDQSHDMQELAKRLSRARLKRMGIDEEELGSSSS